MRVRAKKLGFGGKPPSRRVPGEVFEVAGEVPAYCERVPDDTPLGKPSRQRAEPQQYAKVKGEVVPVTDGGVSGGGQPLMQADPPDTPDPTPADTGNDLT